MRPAVAYLGAVNVFAEELYFFTSQQMLQRGFGLLSFDVPGIGELLRVHRIRAQLGLQMKAKQLQSKESEGRELKTTVVISEDV